MRSRWPSLASGGGDIRPCAQIFGEALAALQLRRLLRRAEHGNARCAQRIAQPIHQRRLWPHNHQADVICLTEGNHRRMVGGVQADRFGIFGNAGVARRGIEPILCVRQQPGLRQLPCQRIFASAAAEQKDIHDRSRF